MAIKDDSRELGHMLVSAAKGRTVLIDTNKVSTGSFFTTADLWLNAPVRKFLKTAFARHASALDPFAGDGHLLDLVAKEFSVSIEGFDIQGNRWPHNDSLLQVPNPRRAVIITNPPYLANHSAKRKGVHSLAAPYFSEGRDNLYKVALDTCLAAADYVVAIIPETFLHSAYPTERLVLASVIEADLFEDTDAPALVACFGPKATNNHMIYLGETQVSSLEKIISLRLNPELSNRRRPVGHEIHFNDPNGRIGLRAVDSSTGVESIAFLEGKDFDYPRSKVKVSSRLMTYIEVPELNDSEIAQVIAAANRLLSDIRAQSSDLALAPFKGNNNQGQRRRRLDYELARRILVQVIEQFRGQTSS
jgi:hypothetical protein